MFRLLKAEIYILFKTRTFKVLCVIAILSGLMLVGISKLMTSEEFIKSSLQGLSSEQQEQYMKSIQDSNNESEAVVKPSACTVGFTIILGIMVLVTTIGSSFMFGWGEPFTVVEAVRIVEVFAGAIVVGMGMISLLMLLATLVKSKGSTIGIGIVVMSVLPSIISFLYGKYDWFDKIYESTISYNWALVTSSRAGNGDILKAAVIGIITLVIATTAGITIFKKQDIK